MSDKVTVAKLDLNVDDLLKKASETKKKIDELAQAQKELATDTEEGRLQFVKNQAQLSKLRGEYGQQSKAVGALIQANGELISVEKALETALNAEVSTINEATKQNQNLKKIRNDVNVTTVEGRKAYDLINEKIKQNDEFIKSNVSELEQQKIGIGGYGDAIKEALGGTSLFSKALGENTSIQKVGAIGFQIVKKEIDGFKASLGQSTAQTVTNTASTIQNTGATEARTAVGFQLNKQTEAQATATNTATVAQRAQTIATNAGSNAFKLFRLALIATGVGAFVVVLGSLVAFLTSTQKGIDAVTSVLRPLQAIGQSLLGVFQRVGEALFETFSNPKQALLDLVDLIQTNLLNRWEAFRVVLEGIKNLDFKQVSNGFLQATTGVENVIDKVSEAGKNTAKFFADAAARGKEIDRLSKEIEKSEIELNKQRAIAESREKELQLIARDTSRTAAEREKAAREIIQIKQEEAKREEGILKLRIQRLEIEQELNDTNRAGNKELADLEAQLIKTKDAAKDAELEQIRVISAARKEQQEKFKAAEKEATERLIKRKEDELALFQEQQRLQNQTLENQRRIADKEIDILRTKLEKKKITELEFQTAKLKIDNDLLLAEQQANDDELQRIADFEARKKQLQNEIDLQNELDEENKKVLKLSQDLDQQLLDLENIELTETEKGDLRKLIIERFNNEIEALNEQSLQRQLQAQTNFNNEQIKLEEKKNQVRADLAKQFAGVVLGILGDSLAAQVAGIALEALLETSKIRIATASAQAINLANATASAPPPLNLPFIAAAQVQNGILKANSAIQQQQILASSAIKTFGAVAKFEKGGLMSIGGKRHSAGGTKFVGEDGTRFEAERGELIGVLNRGAAETFMNFNNMFGRGQVGTSFAENGGLISRAIETSGQVDFEKLAESLRQSPPIVYVEDVIEKANTRNQIVNYADF